MNKIVKQHVPVDQLPKGWQEELPPAAAHVRVEIEVESAERLRSIAELVGSSRNIHGNPDEVVAHISRLRDDG